MGIKERERERERGRESERERGLIEMERREGRREIQRKGGREGVVGRKGGREGGEGGRDRRESCFTCWRSDRVCETTDMRGGRGRREWLCCQNQIPQHLCLDTTMCVFGNLPTTKIQI